MTPTRVSPSVPDLCGALFDDRYELEAIVGEGSFGRVYRARDRRLGRAVAVKVIKPWWAEDPAWVRAFERETQLLASLSHPGIVAIFDVGAGAEGLFLVSELVTGGSLARRLADIGALPPAEARRIAGALCRALGCAHAGRIVHRDVKPENVLLAADGSVKVGDFGIARLAESTTEVPGGTIVGTPRYMAPEQARGGAVSPATDVYAAGVVLYEMLVGRTPFSGTSAVELALRHVSDPPPPLPPAVPDDLAAVVHRALAKAPADRFADGAAMADALDVPAPRRAVDPPPAEVPNDAVLGGGPDRPADERPPGIRAAAPTRVGDPRSRRRNVNPAERRQRVALLLLVGLLIAGLVAAAALLAAGHVRVPTLGGLRRGTATVRLRDAGLHAAFAARYSHGPTGTVVAQRPAARASVRSGSVVTVVLSAGPAPVAVPHVTGLPGSLAGARLAAVGLRSTLAAVPAPGAATGVVVAEAPVAGARLIPGRTVALQVAAPPQWRALTAVGGSGDGRSVPFRILGRHWRLSITMAYQGTCTFIFFCSGPSAQVVALPSGRPVDGFDLGTGTDQHRIETSGPGLYQVLVSAGSDTARWRITVDDRY